MRSRLRVRKRGYWSKCSLGLQLYELLGYDDYTAFDASVGRDMSGASDRGQAGLAGVIG